MTADRLERAVDAAMALPGCGLAPYITAGDGGLDVTRSQLLGLQQAGATCIELGLPFSDPIADGPVLQAAAERALAVGTTFDGVLEMVAGFRADGGTVPLLAFTYANLLVRRGLKRACEDLASAGVDGLLVPDLPVEEAHAFKRAADDADLALVLFATPTTADVRIARAGELSRGFLYVVGRTGVTGSSTACDETLLSFLRRVRSLTERPLGLGFGLGSAEQVAAVAPHVDLAIVGSALVDRLHCRLVDLASPGERAASPGERAASPRERAASPREAPACDDARSVARELLDELRPPTAETPT